MLPLRFDADDPAGHLACDEMTLRWAESGRRGECLRVYEVHRPAVVLGVSSRCVRDVHTDACRRDGVPVLRRASGGGTVLIGPGCLNYSVTLDTEARPALRGVHASYDWIVGRLAAALAPQCPRCGRAGLSDLAVDGRKVGGSAQKRGRRFVLHHGTLLYGLRIADLSRYLREPEARPEYRGGRPHGAFVANLPCGAAALCAALAVAFEAARAQPPFEVRGDMRREVESLAEARYRNDEWTLRR